MADGDLLLEELLDTFRVEAQDHLGAMSALLVTLEHEHAAKERGDLLETILRRMHTLKGAAHAVNLDQVAKRCEELEDLLAALKRGDLELDATLFDRLHDDIDALSSRLFGGEGVPAAEYPGASPPFSGPDLLPRAGAPASPAPEPPEAVPPAPKESERGAQQHDKTPGETVRVSTRLLETLLLQAEELVSAKLAASALADELCAFAAEVSGRAASVARAADLAREATGKGGHDPVTGKLASFAQLACQDLANAGARLRALEKSALKHQRTLRGMVDPLLDDVKKLHLLPFSSLTDPFAKMVRDLGRELDKEAEVACSGCDLEVDRRILAQLKEPLLHLVRNVMDHGIEKPSQRKACGKPARGRIAVEVRLLDANRAEVLVSDDGRGIDAAQVKGAALRLELASREALDAMPDAEALQFVFESGVSTSPIITTLSGRGVGLCIVREAVEKLGGHVSVSSEPGKGTVFRLLLPLCYAMMRALLVEAAGRPCFIPAANVELGARFAAGAIRSVENRETVAIGGEVLSLVSLSRLLGLNEQAPDDGDPFRQVVLLHAGEKRMALAVDRVVEVQEILVKPLGSQLSRVRNVAGATVLGNGRVVQVLNVGDLFRSALAPGSAGVSAGAPRPAPKQKRLSVLVVEDSITSRTLLKNILEASGFLVQTAVDGVDALSLLRTDSFDVVVSDVEMPRMDGFELTAAIRGEKRWEELPVILVTGLESRSDRERGIDVGANAYVVKSSFDQGSLIDAIHKLT